MSDERRRRKLRQRTFQMPLIDPGCRLVEVMVEYPDGTEKVKQVTLFSLRQTLTQLHRRGYIIRPGDNGREVVAEHPARKVLQKAGMVEEGRLLPAPAPDPQPQQEEPLTMAQTEKKRIIQNPFTRERNLTVAEGHEFVRLYEKLLEYGWRESDISRDACGYASVDNAKRQYLSLKGGGRGASVAALRGLRQAVAKYQSKAQDAPGLPISPETDAAWEEATVALEKTIQAPQSIDWMEGYIAAVKGVTQSALSLVDAIEAVPKNFRGQQMLKLRDDLIRALEEHDA